TSAATCRTSRRLVIEVLIAVVLAASSWFDGLRIRRCQIRRFGGHAAERDGSTARGDGLAAALLDDSFARRRRPKIDCLVWRWLGRRPPVGRHWPCDGLGLVLHQDRRRQHRHGWRRGRG